MRTSVRIPLKTYLRAPIASARAFEETPFPTIATLPWWILDPNEEYEDSEDVNDWVWPSGWLERGMAKLAPDELTAIVMAAAGAVFANRQWTKVVELAVQEDETWLKAFVQRTLLHGAQQGHQGRQHRVLSSPPALPTRWA